MDSSIYKYILRYSTRQQIILTVMAFISFPFLYGFFELPKMIINDAIQAKSATVVVPLIGIEMDQIPFLFMLCGVFLVLVIINQAFKYVINVYRGLTGERMLRRLRYDLYSRMLRFPLPTFRKKSQGEIIAMIATEVEPLGGFIGEAFSLPAFQGGTLLVTAAFLFIQSPFLGLAAVALYPVQFYLIPKLQRKVNLAAKERVRLVRRLSDRIGETVQGVQEIHAHDTSNLELAEFSSQLGAIFTVRYRIYIFKFIIKFLNNFIQQLGPFFFFLVGGYLTIEGTLEIGTLVAALTAHKEMGAPWKELLAFYQRLEDSRIKYQQVVEQFEPSDMLAVELQIEEPEESAPLAGDINVANVDLQDEQEVNIVDGASFALPVNQRVALVGPSGSGKEEMAMLLARLLSPDKGTITIGALDMARQPEAVTGRRMSFVGSSAFVFNQSLGENLFYGLKHRPLIARDYGGEAAKQRDHFVAEANASGSSSHDIEADWIDYATAGAADDAALYDAALRVLKLVALDEDVYHMGLRGTVETEERAEVADSILRARVTLRARLADPAIAPLIERFDPASYNANATVGENLLFGTPVDNTFGAEQLAENAYVNSVLAKANLTEPMLAAGFQTAATMVELFADLPPDHEFFQQFGFISAEDLPDYQALMTRANRERLDELRDEDRLRLMSLPFKLIPARHRLDIVTEELRGKILEARKIFADDLPDDLRDKVAFFDPDRYNAAANLQDNILFGKVAYGQAQAQERVGALIREVVEELGLYDTVVRVGLNYQVGIAGSRLTSAQRQKLAIARAVIKRPDLLILSEATGTLDSASQAKIMDNILTEFSERGLIWSLHRASDATAFDYVLVMKGGRIVQQGKVDDVTGDGSALTELMAAE